MDKNELSFASLYPGWASRRFPARLGGPLAALLLAIAAGSFAQAAGDPPTPAAIELEVVSAKQLKEVRKSGDHPLSLVNFWATWCGPCVDEFPELVELSQKYRESGLHFVTVSANGKEEQDGVVNFLARFQPESRNLLMGDSDTYTMMKSFDGDWKETLPYTVLVNRKGKIVFRHEGRVDINQLEESIRQELER